MELFFVTGASLLAGFIDAIVGGGGLILAPALFAAYAAVPAATILGTNKSASIWGSAFAARQYSRRVTFNWHLIRCGIAASLVGSLLGAATLLYIPSDVLKRALPFILGGVFVYTFLNKQLGQSHAPRFQGRQEVVVMSAMAFCIGFYDGFFGPGAGSFFIFFLVRLMGYDFLRASAHAKVFNTATNFAALALFAYKGHVWWQISIFLLLGNIVGSLLGARLAMKHGAGFVRWIFIGVVLMLIVKTAHDALAL